MKTNWLLSNQIEKFKQFVLGLILFDIDTFMCKFYVRNNLILNFKKIDPKAMTPTKAHDDDAGWDMYALERCYIPTHEWRAVRTGLAFEIPTGWHMQIHTRSSYAKVKIKNHLGIIDSGYRNEVLVLVYNNGTEDFIIEKGSKFCQALILPVPHVVLVETDQLSESDRGLGGFGSSGK